MDPENVLKSEIFRPIVITIVPGMVLLTPYLYVAGYFHSDLFNPLDKYQVLALAFMLGLAIAAGYIAENIGSQIEHIFWERVKNEDDEDRWTEYLNSTVIKNCLADGYIKDLVLRMKFENSFAVSLFAFWIGYTWLYNLDVVTNLKTYAFGSLALWGFISYLLWESCCSVKLLRDTRNKVKC